MATKIYFDMDGTVYDLYGIKGWKEMLESEREEVFKIGEPLVNMMTLEEVAKKLIETGIEIGIITWLPRDASKEYEAKCAKVKEEWKNLYMPYVNEFYTVPYGTAKHKVPVKKSKTMILFDDNYNVRCAWDSTIQRKSYNVDQIIEDMMKILEGVA